VAGRGNTVAAASVATPMLTLSSGKILFTVLKRENLSTVWIEIGVALYQLRISPRSV